MVTTQLNNDDSIISLCGHTYYEHDGYLYGFAALDTTTDIMTFNSPLSIDAYYAYPYTLGTQTVQCWFKVTSGNIDKNAQLPAQWN